MKIQVVESIKARKQAKQSYTRGTTTNFHLQTGVSVCESQLECDYLNLRIFEGDFEALTMQPKSFEYFYEDKKRRYTPDAESIENGIIIYDEIKYSTEAAKVENINKHSILSELFKSIGCEFRIWTELDIRIGERHNNLKYLCPMLRHKPPVDEVNHLKTIFTDDHYRIQDLLKLLRYRNLDPSIIRRGLAHKLILADLTIPFENLIIYWN